MSRPQLALVLGRGGVRSVAALGIVEVLGEAGLLPGLVVGCSSGALFGACIAMGWSGRAGLAAAARLIRERIECAFGDARFADLKIPLRIAATAAATGQPFVFDRGRLADAVRASMALPFLFPSVEIDGRRFTDGVLSDPLPVSLARDAGAVLTVGFRGALPRRIDRASRLVAQVTTTMINSLQHAQLRGAQAAGTRMLHFDLDIDRRIGLWETEAMPRIFDIGSRAAREQLPAIRRMLELPLAA